VTTGLSATVISEFAFMCLCHFHGLTQVTLSICTVSSYLYVF
jgi:hypothetical protein